MAENHYMPQTKVDWTSNNASSQFKLWRKEVERIIGGPLASRSDRVKINHIYIWAGAHAESLIEARLNEDPELRITTPKELLDQLTKCLTHSILFREKREEFYTARQKIDENTTSYYSRLLDLYRQAEFPENTNFLIVDKLIHGCISKDCKRKLMAKGKEVSVKDCLELMRKYEAVEATMKKFEESNDTHVDASYTQDPTKKSQRNGSRKIGPKSKLDGKKSGGKKSCVWCNRDAHPRDKCPAKDATCTFCCKQGHFERACLQKKGIDKSTNLQAKSKHQLAVGVDPDEDSSEYEYDFDLSVVSIHAVDNQKSREVFAPVLFHPKGDSSPSYEIRGKVDTGAMVSCMPTSMLSKIGLSKKDLRSSSAIIRGMSGADLQNCGFVDISVTCNDITAKSRFYVTKQKCAFILGLGFCKQFKLVTIAPVCIQQSIHVSMEPCHVEAVHITEESEADYHSLQKKWKKHLPLGRKTGDPLEDLKQIFPETFDGQVGLFEGEVSLKLSPEAKPVQLPPRAVPQSIMPQLKKELDKMEQEGIIRACPETTEWVHNLVTVVKKDGTLRLCLDPRNLNKYLIRNIHYTASWEDVQHSFRNGQYFSTLDAKSGYWTKQLDEQSQLLTAFNTPFKKYCFVRLPFGLSASSEIFCEHMDRILAGIPGTFPCADDVKVQGSTEVRHDIHLLETVEKARNAGLKFNPNKCFIKKQQIEYFGRIITPQGVQPCPKKVKAITALAAPTDKQELQSLLGTVNFMSTFIPNLTKKTHLMRSLLKRDSHFVWTSDMQKELNTIKNDIATAVELIHYDPNKPAIIETDASLKGIGAVLTQDGKPVHFLSKALTPAEANYTNIERELLAILFACEKLHRYTFGRKITVHTDHKPLQAIFQKPVSLAPPRLQRMLLRLSKYDTQVKYVGSKSVLLADTLSRLVQPGTAKEIPGLDINIAQVMKVEPTRLESLQEETKADSTLASLTDFIITGWPDSMQDLPDNLHPYWCFRDELTILDGLVMKGSRVVIPASMRSGTLARLHDAHQGLTSTLQRARRTVYWPKLQDDISEMVQKCDECQRYGNKKPRPPERQISATRPLELLGVDVVQFQRQRALVTVDYYSGFLTYDTLSSETTEAVTKALNNIFRKFGLPERIISDNGPCFKSEKFRCFCDQLDIGHVTSSPYHHQSNGRVERAIATVEQILRKSASDTDITKALITYLDTPISGTLPSPAELFYSRPINTRLSMSMKPTPLTDQQKADLNDKRSTHLRPLKHDKNVYIPNQPIWFTDDNSNEWAPGYIDSNDTSPDSYWIITEKSDRRLRRNKRDIKPRHTTIAQQRPQRQVPVRFTTNLPDQDPTPADPSAVSARASEDAPYTMEQTSPASSHEKELQKNSSDETARAKPADSTPQLTRSRSGRVIKPPTNPDFVYN